MNGKWVLILGLTVGSALAVWFMGIRLGLDLKGGIHLVIRVQTDDAVKAELNDGVNRLRLRLDEKKVPYKSVEPVLDPAAGKYEILLKGVSADDLDRARKVAETALREYSRDMRGADFVASLPEGRLVEIRDSTVEQALTTIGERINATGVAEPIIQRKGRHGVTSDQILVQLPGVSDPEHVKQLIGRVALLELKLVDTGPYAAREDAFKHYGVGAEGSLPTGLEVIEGSDKEGGTNFYVVQRVPVITGRDLSRAQPGRNELNEPTVNFSLNADGAKKFGDATSKNIGKFLAIVLDGRVKSAPVIKNKISDRGMIEGSFTAEEARDLSLVLRAGALPATIQYLEERTVGPSLGRESIWKGFVSGIIGLAVIIVAMLVYYRLAGLNAVVALILNAVLLLGAIALLRATLTLAGIAGVILTIGMAVDANVLIFESIRENLRKGVQPKRAVEEGFEAAFATIVDTHLTTILAALALWMLGSQSIRGFGVTLLIGLLISLFTAYFVSKVMFETFVLRREWKAGETLSI